MKELMKSKIVQNQFTISTPSATIMEAWEVATTLPMPKTEENGTNSTTVQSDPAAKAALAAREPIFCSIDAEIDMNIKQFI